MKGTSLVGSFVAAHSEKFSISTRMMSSSSRCPSAALTLGAGVGVGELVAEGAGQGDGEGVGVGDCALVEKARRPSSSPASRVRLGTSLFIVTFVVGVNVRQAADCSFNLSKR